MCVATTAASNAALILWSAVLVATISAPAVVTLADDQGNTRDDVAVPDHKKPKTKHQPGDDNGEYEDEGGRGARHVSPNGNEGTRGDDD